jgi:hypothetical protein
MENYIKIYLVQTEVEDAKWGSAGSCHGYGNGIPRLAEKGTAE